MFNGYESGTFSVKVDMYKDKQVEHPGGASSYETCLCTFFAPLLEGDAGIFWVRKIPYCNILAGLDSSSLLSSTESRQLNANHDSKKVTS